MNITHTLHTVIMFFSALLRKMQQLFYPRTRRVKSA